MSRRSDDARGIRVHAGERLNIGEAEFQCRRRAGFKMQRIMSGHFRSHKFGIDGGLVAMDEVVVKSVFDVRSAIFAIE